MSSRSFRLLDRFARVTSSRFGSSKASGASGIHFWAIFRNLQILSASASSHDSASHTAILKRICGAALGRSRLTSAPAQGSSLLRSLTTSQGENCAALLYPDMLRIEHALPTLAMDSVDVAAECPEYPPDDRDVTSPFDGDRDVVRQMLTPRRTRPAAPHQLGRFAVARLRPLLYRLPAARGPARHWKRVRLLFLRKRAAEEALPREQYPHR